jgi:hypothetical protein
MASRKTIASLSAKFSKMTGLPKATGEQRRNYLKTGHMGPTATDRTLHTLRMAKNAHARAYGRAVRDSSKATGGVAPKMKGSVATGTMAGAIYVRDSLGRFAHK